MKRQISILVVLLLALLLFTATSYSQPSFRVPLKIYPETGTDCDSDEARFMWEDINGFRTDTGIMPVAFSQTLCEIAEDHLNDLVLRIEIDNRQERSDGTYLADWLSESNYRQYRGFDADDYVARMVVWISPDLDLLRNGINPGIVEWNWNQVDTNGLYGMISNSNYREVGLAYQVVPEVNGTLQHYAVFIFGSQPGTFPVIPVYLANDGSISRPANPLPDGYTGVNYAYEATDPTIGLIFHTENIDGYERGVAIIDENGAQGISPGEIQYVRYAASPDDRVTCPAPNQQLPDGWINYSQLHLHTFSGSNGLTILHFQLCDGLEHDAMTSVTIDYIGGIRPPTDTPTVPPTPSITYTPSPTQTATINVEGTAGSIVNTEVAATVQAQETMNAIETATADVVRQTATFEAALTNAAANAIANATATQIESDTGSNENTEEPDPELTPDVMGTPTPFSEIRVYWQFDYMVIYNASDEEIDLDDLTSLSFVDANENELAMSEVLNRTTIDLFREDRCILVHATLERPTNNEILSFQGNCNLEFDLTAWMQTDNGDGRIAVWQTDSFDVYYDGVFVTHCEADAFTNLNECVIN